jgi:hypothetical protein
MIRKNIINQVNHFAALVASVEASRLAVLTAMGAAFPSLNMSTIETKSAFVQFMENPDRMTARICRVSYSHAGAGFDAPRQIAEYLEYDLLNGKWYRPDFAEGRIEVGYAGTIFTDLNGEYAQIPIEHIQIVTHYAIGKK